MRIENLEKIKIYLSPIVESKGYFIYIAPLNKQHYNLFVSLVYKRTCETKSIKEFITDKNNLIDLCKMLDINTEILVDTDLYVSKKNSYSIDEYYKLIDFLKFEHIDYRLLISSNHLISVLENKPKDELND